MKGRILAELEQRVWPKIESGTIRPLMYTVLPIAEADAAHAILSRNENTGKVALVIKPEHDAGVRAG